jgi:heat shock protein HtpX
MTIEAGRLPSRNWSIVALGSAGAAAVVLSYLLAAAAALACIALPYFVFVEIPLANMSFLFARFLLSAFGLVAGFTILWSLAPRRSQFEVRGVLIDLAMEKRLARHLGEIAAALKEPMPSEVYLIADANAFVAETGGLMGQGTRRVMGLGLPLLQMLTISQFRAVLAHEFAHYYAGDTRLGPWVYNTRATILRVYENLGKKSDALSILARWWVVAMPYMLLMGAMRLYWTLFMRVTQSISRRQEYRSDELACHVAGSQPLIDGLQNIRRCEAALRAYWTSLVLPVAAGGFKPQFADGFMRFMTAPQIAKATSDALAKHIATAKTNPFDTHPHLSKRIEKARAYNLPAPASPGQDDGQDAPMISVIDNLDSLESDLLKMLVPALAKSELKPMNWETAGLGVFVPMWRKQVEGFVRFLATRTLAALPGLVKEPKAIANKVPNPPGMLLNQAQRDARALEILSFALTLSLLDHDWKLMMQPGTFYLECEHKKLEPPAIINALRAGKLAAEEWQSQCSALGIADWRLAALPEGQAEAEVPEQEADEESAARAVGGPRNRSKFGLRKRGSW